MIVKTSELTGAALDWAVAMAEGKAPHCEIHAGNVLYGAAHTGFCQYRPSEDWRQGGPIIEREGISTVRDQGDDYWQAVRNANSGSMFGPGICGDNWQTGPTPLITAMRCHVASKLGETVDIPEGLT